MNLQFDGWLSRASVAAFFVALLGFSNGALAAAAAPPAVLTADQISKLLADGTNILTQGNADLAIKNYFEPVNQSFMRQTASAGADDEIYASHSATETDVYTKKVAKENEGAAKPVRMVAVDGAWTDALLLKARAQVALNKTSAAKSTLDQASVLSPVYPYVWIEYGKLHKSEKDWDKMLSAYKTTENYAGAVEDKVVQKQLLATGLHGQAEALIELGRLDEAEALYKRCLKMDAGDTAATDGLAQINARRGPAAPGAASPGAASPGAAGASAPAPAPSSR
jgi:tetratricopeptide (TPR) repeat protein